MTSGNQVFVVESENNGLCGVFSTLAKAEDFVIGHGPSDDYQPGDGCERFLIAGDWWTVSFIDVDEHCSEEAEAA